METPTCASTPFDHAKADVILRSADGVEFRVFKLFLSLASPFFETLFDPPQAHDGDTDQEMKDGLAVIAMSEDSKTLDYFLRFCYPSTLAEDPVLENLTDVLSMLAAAKKYSLDLIETRVSQALANPKFLETDPFRCFVIARNARLKHETITAAKSTLRKPLIPAWFAEIELITASELLSLLTYHKNCGIATQALVKDLAWLRDYYVSENECGWIFGRTDRGRRNCCGQARATDETLFPWNSTAPLAWWETYMRETFSSLMDRPSGDTVRSEADKTIQKVRGAGCTTCSENVKMKMTEFSNLLASKVEETVASVCLDLLCTT